MMMRYRLLLAGALAVVSIASTSTSTSAGPLAPGQEVHIIRDAHGVPHIKAATDAAAFYGLGWATATDRLFQMHVQLWSAQGRMAEFFGASHIEADREARLFGIWRHAQRVSANLSGEVAVFLQAYADGVNDYVASHPDASAALFGLAKAAPERWAPEHSIAVWNRFANFFSGSPVGKAAEYYAFQDLVAQIGMERAIAAYQQPQHPGDPEAAVVQEADVPAQVMQDILDYAASLGYGEDGEGFAPFHANPRELPDNLPKFSHAWAVSGSRTSTGKAVLVGDPQLTVSFPNLLYEWRIAGATFNLRGMSLPGVPGPLIGFNSTVAWSLTAGSADNRDLMRLDTTAGGYLYDSRVLPFFEANETIKVAGGPDVPVTYRESVWGPVVTELVETRQGDEWAMYGIPYAEADRDTFAGALAMMRANSMSAFHQATEGWRYPSANLIAGDSSGNVFYILLGAIPVRSTYSPLGGLIGQEGDSSRFLWQDTIPAEFKPWIMNPPSGWIASGNHRAESGWYPLPLGKPSVGGHSVRSARVYENLEALPATSTPSQVFASTQFDCVNLGRRDLVAIATHVRDVGAGGLGADALAAVDHLAEWLAAGGDNHTDQPGVGLAIQISQKFRLDDTGPELEDIYGGGESGLNLFLADHLEKIAADPGYIPDIHSLAYLNKILGDAWRQAYTANPNPGQWDADYAAGPIPNPVSKHFASPFLIGPGFGSAQFEPETLQCADGNTIWSQPSQTYSQMVDLGRVDRSVTIMPPGDTEKPEVATWDSQAAGWVAGSYKQAPLSDAAISQIAVSDEILIYEG